MHPHRTLAVGVVAWMVLTQQASAEVKNHGHAEPVEHDGHENASTKGAAEHPRDHASHGGHENHTNHAFLGGAHDHGTGTRLALSVSLVAATYRNPLFEGDYQGGIIGASVARGRLGFKVLLPAYRLVRNGAAIEGIGDLALHAHATVFELGPVAAGAMLMCSAPTGDGDRGLGMGHAMLMPEAWAIWVPSRLALAVSAGYAYAFGGASAHAEHGGGMWPLVDPMNASEITFGGTGMLAVAPTVGIGVHAYGAVPTGDGSVRLAGGGRVAWAAGRMVTSAELLGGVVGEPFGIRGVLETSIHFE